MISPSIGDAIRDIRNGTFGDIDVFKIGDIFVDVLTAENGSDEMQITTHPVQAGFEVTTAAIRVPTTKTLSIVLMDPEYSAGAFTTAAITGSVQQLTQTKEEKVDKLYSHFNSRDIIDIVSMSGILQSMIIESITPIYESSDTYDVWVADVRVRKYEIYGTDFSNAESEESKQFAKKFNAGRL